MPRDPERMAQAGLIDRSGEIFYHQLAQLRNQLLAYVEMAIGALRMGVFTGNDPSYKREALITALIKTISSKGGI